MGGSLVRTFAVVSSRTCQTQCLAHNQFDVEMCCFPLLARQLAQHFGYRAAHHCSAATTPTALALHTDGTRTAYTLLEFWSRQPRVGRVWWTCWLQLGSQHTTHRIDSLSPDSPDLNTALTHAPCIRSRSTPCWLLLTRCRDPSCDARRERGFRSPQTPDPPRPPIKSASPVSRCGQTLLRACLVSTTVHLLMLVSF